VLCVVAGATLAATFAASYIAHPSLIEWLRPWNIAGRVGSLLMVIIRSPAPILFVALILERWLPVVPNQRDLTRGFWQDIAWYVADFIRDVSWVPLYLALLIWTKSRLFGKFALVPTGLIPAAIAWIAAILAWDLLGYASHVARHRVDFLWRFHTVHHSQRELNFFTQHRFHDLDVIADQTIRIIPLLALNASWNALGIFYVIALAHFRLYHSNIRTDYGVLRYVLVTPQSHRVHHARDSHQHNSNFGIFFSIWDRVFGTQYPHRDEYPDELGIADERFPIDQGTRIRDIPRVYAAQLLYPFIRRV
jgi:sterol desaturase/sphingolipid hydroxylase (fatty acid hydroxylase superfamily)